MRGLHTIGCVLALWAVSAHAETIEGQTRVIDGDTLVITDERIRLWGIDAPEMGQPCEADGQTYDAGARAAEGLSAIIGGQDVRCDVRNRDRWGRAVAACAVRGRDIGRSLVATGLARDYARYSSGHYADAESAARSQSLGIWAGPCDAPWEWRRGR